MSSGSGGYEERGVYQILRTLKMETQTLRVRINDRIFFLLSSRFQQTPHAKTSVVSHVGQSRTLNYANAPANSYNTTQIIQFIIHLSYLKATPTSFMLK